MDDASVAYMRCLGFVIVLVGIVVVAGISLYQYAYLPLSLDQGIEAYRAGQKHMASCYASLVRTLWRLTAIGPGSFVSKRGVSMFDKRLMRSGLFPA